MDILVLGLFSTTVLQKLFDLFYFLCYLHHSEISYFLLCLFRAPL